MDHTTTTRMYTTSHCVRVVNGRARTESGAARHGTRTDASSSTSSIEATTATMMWELRHCSSQTSLNPAASLIINYLQGRTLQTTLQRTGHDDADGTRRQPAGVRAARRGQRALTSRTQTDHTMTIISGSAALNKPVAAMQCQYISINCNLTSVHSPYTFSVSKAALNEPVAAMQ